MLQYETIFVTEPTLTEEEIDDLIKGYDGLVTSAQGKVLKVEKWGKRRLAYPILRREEGNYLFMVVGCPTHLVKEIARRDRMNKSTLRALTAPLQHKRQLRPFPVMKPPPILREQ